MAAEGPSPLRTLRRLLRSPRTIVAELLLVAVAGVLSTAVPQLPTPSERVQWSAEHPLAAPVVRALGLDAVFSTGWFLALVLLSAGSLAIVLVEQWQRLGREWGAVPGEQAFRSAPLRMEFERPARGAASRIAVRHRIGLLGSPLFHAGLMVVILAGAGRTLFGADAVVHLHEGEVLEPRAEAFGAQWTGPLARPVAFADPIEVRELVLERYPSGALRALRARLAVRGPQPREELVGINTPLDLGLERLYLSGKHGVNLWVEVLEGGRAERRILVAEEADLREYVRSEPFPGDLKLRLRAMGGAAGERPRQAEVRVLRDGALLAAGTLQPGQALPLPGGGHVALYDLRYWARFSAARDLSAWPAYLGFGLALLGAALMFTVVKVDEAVLVRREGERERVTVALRPHRLAPLFRERLSRLAREEGGPAPG